MHKRRGQQFVSSNKEARRILQLSTQRDVKKGPLLGFLSCHFRIPRSSLSNNDDEDEAKFPSKTELDVVVLVDDRGLLLQQQQQQQPLAANFAK